jgi:hypothetical protein
MAKHGRISRLTRHLPRLALVCVVALASVRSPVLAESPDTATRAAAARTLFQEGVELADASRWPEAADRFRQALTLRESPVIAYNLASALRQLGRLVEASSLLRGIADDAGADPALRASATTALADITPRIGRLTIEAEGLEPGDHIAIDDQAVPGAQLGVAISVDPGSHIVTARRGDRVLYREPLIVFEGTSRELTLQLARSPAPRDAAKSVASAERARSFGGALDKPRADRASSSNVPWWLWAGAGALLVGAVAMAAVVASNGDSADGTIRGDFDPPVVHIGAE